MADAALVSGQAPIIVTDATCDLPRAILAEYGIYMLPIRIHFGDDTYLGGTDMRLPEFVARLARGGEFPTTSTLTTEEMRAHFETIGKAGRPILAVLLSSKLSQTVAHAEAAARQLEGKVAVTVRDSLTISGTLGLQVLTAARAAKAGRSIAEIIPLLDQCYRDGEMFFCMDDLSFLHHGGRIGLVSYHVAKTLGLKPVVTVSKEGETRGTYVPGSDRPRSLKAAISAFEREVARVVSARQPVRVLIPHGDAFSAGLAGDLKVRLVERFHCVQIETFPASAVNAAHVGPRSLEIAFAPGDWPV